MTHLRTQAARDAALALADQAEKAITEQEERILWLAALLLYPRQREDHAERVRIRTLIDLAAYESAALELVPDGCVFSQGVSWSAGDCGENDGPWACVTVYSDGCPDYTGLACTVPLSLVAACMRAHGRHPYALGEAEAASA